ncbi:hypothetical protein DPM19_05735 [Actinomadura craniellae]|uniref:Uncharacterized protein n=1 Tax=Actinomadura craniellae TaxID=2231787 RepID=A0A365HB98_9ACTN|nr:hypothetical protein [Actinomadura craniellae]RAY16377.1 hypothetical protein DPM19_05735 [Actinomadura craniellae]
MTANHAMSAGMPPVANPDGITTGTPCGCTGCAAHEGPCRSLHQFRHPQTKTAMYLEDTERGPRCPYCLLVTTRPGATGQRAAAALERPAAAGQQDGLFDAAPYRTRHRGTQ